MRPRTLRELTDLARDEMAPTVDERARVYTSLCAAVATSTAGAAVLGTSATASAAVSTTAASTTAAPATAALSAGTATTGAAAQAGGALAGGLSSSGLVLNGLVLKGLVLVLAIGGGAGLLSVAEVHDGGIPEQLQVVIADEPGPLRPATNRHAQAPPEAALIEPGPVLGSQRLALPALPALPPRPVDAPHGSVAPLREVAGTTAEDPIEPPLTELSRNTRTEHDVDAALTLAARRLQRAQRAMARGDGAATLELLNQDVDPRLRAERLALRVLALCQLGDERNARRDANELRALVEPSSAAVARIASSCVGP